VDAVDLRKGTTSIRKIQGQEAAQRTDAFLGLSEPAVAAD